ncbi:hypothetical protein AN191_04995 [Loktanella sp. 5RATIMAR09]|nr:hypothetical protein AN191_04995 [Loktanella sp. 5RATIMAR09]
MRIVGRSSGKLRYRLYLNDGQMIPKTEMRSSAHKVLRHATKASVRLTRWAQLHEAPAGLCINARENAQDMLRRAPLV